MDKETDRKRTVTWSDPMIAARQASQLSGFQFLQGIIEGEIPPPPVAILTRIKLIEVEEGRAVFELTPDESLYNPIGSVHGGIIATICDSAASCAVQSLLPADQIYTTLEIKVNFFRPVTHRIRTLSCIGQVIYAGRRTATAEARLVDSSGKLYAQATASCILVQVES